MERLRARAARPAAAAACCCCSHWRALALLLLLLLLAACAAAAQWGGRLRPLALRLKEQSLAALPLGGYLLRPLTLASARASLPGGGRLPVSQRSLLLLREKAALLRAFAGAPPPPPPGAGSQALVLAVQNQGGIGAPWGVYARIAPWASGRQPGCPVACELFASGPPPPGVAVAAYVAMEPAFTQDRGGLPDAAHRPVLAQTLENFYHGSAAAAGGDALAFGGARASLAAVAAAAASADWLSSFELDSDVPFLYIAYVRALLQWREPLAREALPQRLRFADRLPALAAFVSNCDTGAMLPPRAAYIRELSAHYPVHHYGACRDALHIGGEAGALASAAGALRGNASLAAGFPGALETFARRSEDGDDGDGGGGGSSGNFNDAKLGVLARYRYAIAIENSVGLDYVTEKLYEPLAAGAVPVYLGAPNWRDFAPAGSAVLSARDFASPAALGAHLRALDAGGEAAWLAHHAWRAQGVPENVRLLQALGDLHAPTLACRFCGCAAGLLGCGAPQGAAGRQRQ
jgi:hypothetical protein